MKSITLFILLLCGTLLLVACNREGQPETMVLTSTQEANPSTVLEESIPESIPAASEADLIITAPIVCERNDECQHGLHCIDQNCKSISSLNNNTNCKQLCEVAKAYFHTSDNEEYALSKGQGTYTAAGALEWKLMSFPAYCKGEQPHVLLLLLKKNAGKVLEETVITLQQGDTSDIVTHPTVKRVQFRVTLTALEESCK